MMAGNSQRKGSVRKSTKKPAAGSGGRRKRGLEGKGPTPKATERTYHKAHRSGEKSAGTGTGGRPGRPRGGSSKGRGGKSPSEFVAGKNPVIEAIREGVPIAGVYVAAGSERDGKLREAFKLAAERGLNLTEVTRGELDRLTNNATHQGLAARIHPFAYTDPDEMLQRAADAGEPALIIALDSVTDPRNLGAIIRSAAAFGAHGVVVPERRAANMTASAWKASAGAAARLPVARVVNLVRQLKAFQDAGCMVAGLAADGEVDLSGFDLSDGPLVLVIGSEGKGLSRLVSETCDQLVSIPMSTGIESLNASVAASVTLFSVSQARSGAGQG